GFGLVAIINQATADRLQPEVLNGGFLVDLADGASVDDVRSVLDDGFAVFSPSSPPNISRLRDVTGISLALLAFFAVFGLAVFAFGMASTARQHRRDFAVLRAVGFRRRQVVGAFCAQALVSLVVVAVIAVPVGAALGRVVWSLTERNLGVLEAYRVPVTPTALTVVGAALGFLLIASLASIPSTRRTVSTNLRAE
ncbi:MAG: FtsX-like permease family protein, partial [Acidimicrobiales bacterium]